MSAAICRKHSSGERRSKPSLTRTKEPEGSPVEQRWQTESRTGFTSDLPATITCKGLEAKASAPALASRTSCAYGLLAAAPTGLPPSKSSASLQVIPRRSNASRLAILPTVAEPAGRYFGVIEGPPSSASNRSDRQHSAAVVCEMNRVVVSS